MYLLWYDDSRKTAADKIAAACEAYAARFRRRPTTAIVSERDAVFVEGLQVRWEPYVRPNNFWVGEEE